MDIFPVANTVLGRSFCLGVACLAVSLPVSAAFTHSLTVLGKPQPNPPGWSVIYVYAADDAGLAGAGNQNPSQAIRSYVWSRAIGSWTVLEPLPGGDQITAKDVNASGQAVGSSNLKTNGLATRGFLWSNGTTTDLGVLGASPYLPEESGGKSSRANAINDAGQIVGNTMTNSGVGHAFLYENGVMKDLGSLLVGGNDSSSEAFDVNNNGQAVGESGGQAVLFENGSVTTLGAGKALVINDRGTIAGINILQPFMIVNGIRSDIAVPVGTVFKPSGINGRGQVVGNGTVGVNPRCFLYENGALKDLAEVADFSRDFISPNCGFCAIDEAGRIYGMALNKSFQNELFVLTPLNEPNPFLGLAAGQWVEASPMGWQYGFQDGPGWSFSFQLGFVYSGYYPWIYHPGQGFLYVAGGSLPEGLFLYSVNLGTFLWIAESTAGIAYRTDTQAAVQFYP